MLWIRDILVRIRIRSSVLLTYKSGSGFRSGSCFFCQWLTRCPQNIFFSSKILALLLLKVHFLSVFVDKKSKKSKNRGNQGFPYFFCLLTEGSGTRSGSVQNNVESGSWRPKNKRIHNTDRGISMVPISDLLPQQL